MNEAQETPLVDRLKNVPRDAHMVYDYSPTHSMFIPVGVMCRAALDEIVWLRAEVESWREAVSVLQRKLRERGDVHD